MLASNIRNMTSKSQVSGKNIQLLSLLLLTSTGEFLDTYLYFRWNNLLIPRNYISLNEKASAFK